MKPVILLVDDNKEILSFLAEDLNEKYSVITALNGQEALNVLERESVQLIISDIMMPVLDGYELCRIVKTQFDYCHLPVILLTSKNTLPSKIEGLEAGADAYIEKPFSIKHLNVQIENLLSNRNKIKEYFAKSPLVHIKGIAWSKEDEHFLDRLNDTIQKNIGNTDLDVEHIAAIMNMSKPTLYRKIKGISDLTPNELITLTRLKRAAELLAEGGYRMYEVADIVGFTSQTVFGKTFIKQFGMTPSEFVSEKQAERGK